MRFGICDDDAADRRLLDGMLGAYLAEKGVEAQSSLYANAQELLKCFSPGAFEVLFLDIYMPGMNGMRAAETVRGVDKDVLLVFITSSPDHAIDSYAVHASGYLLKPFSAEQLAETMDWCLASIDEYVQAIEIISNRETVSIPLKDIFFIEVFGRSCVFHTANGTKTTNRGLNEIEKMLNDAFLRCHRSYIVNMRHILRPEGASFILTGKRSVPIARDGAHKVRQQFYDWSFRKAWESR